MSSWCRSAALAACAFTAVGSATAQEYYVVPHVEAAAEWNSNREMVDSEGNADPSMGYKLIGDALIGRRTPLTTFELRPRVQLQEFPDRSGIDPADYLLDARAQRVTKTSEFGIRGRYARQDVYNAEYGQAAFDGPGPTDPSAPPGTDPGGIVFVGGTRETIVAEPSFRHAFSPLTALGGLVRYERIHYDRDVDFQRVGYDAKYGELVVIRTLGPRAELHAGPYVSRSETDTGSNRTNTVGATVAMHYEWSPTTYFVVSASGERSDVTDFVPTRLETKSTDWGLEFTGVYRQRIGRVRYSVGRYLAPGTFGARRTRDQLRVQYQRPLSPLLELDGAVRLSRDQRVGGVVGENRDRALAELTLTRLLTRTWFVSGGLRYAWQDLNGQSSAHNIGAFVSVGYRGLKRETEDLR